MYSSSRGSQAIALTVKSRRRAACPIGSAGSPVTVKPRWPLPVFDSVRGRETSSRPTLNTVKLAPDRVDAPEAIEQRAQAVRREAVHPRCRGRPGQCYRRRAGGRARTRRRSARVPLRRVRRGRRRARGPGCRGAQGARRPPRVRRSPFASRRQVAYDAEAVVGITERRVELAAGRDPADRHRMAPRSAARRAPHAGPGAGRIAGRRPHVPVARMPVGAPLVDVRGDAPDAVPVRRTEADRPRAFERSHARRSGSSRERRRSRPTESRTPSVPRGRRVPIAPRSAAEPAWSGGGGLRRRPTTATGSTRPRRSSSRPRPAGRCGQRPEHPTPEGDRDRSLPGSGRTPSASPGRRPSRTHPPRPRAADARPPAPLRFP